MTTRTSAQAEHDAFAARQLRTAGELIERYAPAEMTRDKTAVLARLGLMVTNLTQHDTTALCRRCGSSFTFDASHFAAKHLDPPRHCFRCRQSRRQERERAGVSTAVPPPQPENPR
jgi:hypothetical protein